MARDPAGGGAAGRQYFTVLVEVTDGTCGRCMAGQGAILTLEEIVARDLLPPLHPNCRCTIAPWSAPPIGKDGLCPEGAAAARALAAFAGCRGDGERDWI